MPRTRTPGLTLDHLKKEAKRWLQAIRANDAGARARYKTLVPTSRDTPELRDVQLALAREFGFPGWAALKEAFSTGTPATKPLETSPAMLLDRLLDNACPDHHVRGGTDHVRARHAAMRLLERHPEIAQASFQTAVVCGDLGAVTRALAADPGLAVRPGEGANPERAGGGGEGDLVKRDWGPKGWEPLLYLCFTRLPLPAVQENAVAIARLLLDHGANPNAYFMAGASRYTPLVGAIGEGEEGRPAHAQRDALVRLLLERGADPYDLQVAYNMHFNGKVLWYLELVYEHTHRTGHGADWKVPEWRMFDHGAYGTGAHWFLAMAIEHNDLALAEWCLSRGASPNAPPATDRRGWTRPLYEEALVRGRVELAELLVRYGATRTALPAGPAVALIAACMRSDLPAIRREIAARPELIEAPEPLFAAVEHNRRDAVELLLDLGTSPDIESREGECALHIAAYSDSVDVGRLLIERGAEVDAIGRRYENTPLGGAMHCQSAGMIDLLSRHSRSAWEVGFAGNVDRLRELLAEKPERARGYDGETLLMYLPPDDESKAMAVAELLLASGADPAIRDPHGMTAADRAERSGMFTVAAMLRAREA